MTRHSAQGRNYPSRSRGRLTPKDILGVRFLTSRSWRGVDADEVQRFMVRVADDMASLYAELAQAHAENHRIKVALTTWQSERISAAADSAGRPLR